MAKEDYKLEFKDEQSFYVPVMSMNQETKKLE